LDMAETRYAQTAALLFQTPLRCSASHKGGLGLLGKWPRISLTWP
jgi:hypothetical protein